jgi:hypothetical protein
MFKTINSSDSELARAVDYVRTRHKDSELVRMIEYVRIRSNNISHDLNRLTTTEVKDDPIPNRDALSVILACYEYMELQKTQTELATKIPS